jgi:hypothetical protein
MIQKKTVIRTVALLLCLALFMPPGGFAQTFVSSPYVPDEDADCTPPENVDAEPVDGTATKSSSGTLLLQGSATTNYCVPKGTPIKLQLASVPLDGGMKIIERDFDGHLPPAKLFQKITAKTEEDIFVDDHNVIPEGTTFYGLVSKLYGPYRNGIPGHLQITFNKLETPDGRWFAFNVDATNQYKSTWKTKGKALRRDAGYALGGAIVGTMVAYKLTGPKTTVSTKGLNLAVGAGTGAIIATGYALWKKGYPAVLEPGVPLNMNIDTDLIMPATSKPTVKAPPPRVDGLSIAVRKTKRKSDGINNTVMKIDMDVDNETKHRFTSANFYLQDGLGNMNPVSCFGDDIDKDDYNFEVEPHSSRSMTVYFAMTWPKMKHKLVVLDPFTRKPIHSIKVD